MREGILVLHGDELGADLTQTLAEVDRRMLDFVVGLDTEFSELMDGSHLYTPTVDIDEVVLADAKKTLVLETVKNFENYTMATKELELDKKLSYGRGMVLLFYGPSGTGKTMMANALASMIGKKVLMINFPSLGTNQAGAILKLVFREAKIHDAILFFDECESIFMDRTKGNMQVTPRGPPIYGYCRLPYRLSHHHHPSAGEHGAHRVRAPRGPLRPRDQPADGLGRGDAPADHPRDRVHEA